MTTNTLSESSQRSLKYAGHLVALGLWVAAGGLFSLQQLFATHGLGGLMNFWLWFLGYAGLTTLTLRFVKSGVAALLMHGAFAVALNLIPTSTPWSMLRAGYDLLLGA